VLPSGVINIGDHDYTPGRTAWAPWLPGTRQVGRLVRRPREPPRQMLNKGVEPGGGPGALS